MTTVLGIEREVRLTTAAGLAAVLENVHRAEECLLSTDSREHIWGLRELHSVAQVMSEWIRGLDSEPICFGYVGDEPGYLRLRFGIGPEDCEKCEHRDDCMRAY